MDQSKTSSQTGSKHDKDAPMKDQHAKGKEPHKGHGQADKPTHSAKNKT